VGAWTIRAKIGAMEWGTFAKESYVFCRVFSD
jgi:hypothetical protein